MYTTVRLENSLRMLMFILPFYVAVCVWALQTQSNRIKLSSKHRIHYRETKVLYYKSFTFKQDIHLKQTQNKTVKVSLLMIFILLAIFYIQKQQTQSSPLLLENKTEVKRKKITCNDKTLFIINILLKFFHYMYYGKCFVGINLNKISSSFDTTISPPQ